MSLSRILSIEYSWSIRSQVRVLAALTVVLVSLIIGPPMFSRIVNHPFWPRWVLQHDGLPPVAYHYAFRAFRQHISPEDTPLIVTMLQSQNREQKLFAVQWLYYKSKGMLLEMDDVALDKDREIRYYAYKYLADRSPTTNSLRLFISGLDDPHLFIVDASIRGIERLKDNKGVAPLIRLLRRRFDPEYLTTTEELAARTIVQITAAPLDFSPKCWLPIPKGLDLRIMKYAAALRLSDSEIRSATEEYTQAEISRLRQFCGHKGLGAERDRLLRWWDDGGYKTYDKPV